MISKVVILHDYGTVTGGSSAVAHASALGLCREGLSITLLTAVGPVAENLKGVPGLEVSCLMQPEIVNDRNRAGAFVRGIYNRAAVAAVRQTLHGLDPRHTIVHVHTWTKALSAFAVSAAIELGFKVVLTLHDFFVTCPTGGFFVHKASELCSRTPLSLDCVLCHCDRRSYAQKLWRVGRTLIQNQGLRMPEGIAHFIGVSQLSVNVMQPFLPAQIPVTIVRNPIDCRDEGPAPVKTNTPFIYIGRFAKEKGVLLFAEAAGRLGIPAVFVGDGELRKEAERLCPQGTFTGWLPAPEVAQWLRRARALVFPPLWYETLGLVVVEAASHGVPAVIADRCAATDFVKDGTNGLWFEQGSAKSLCAKLTAMEDATLAQKIGQNAYDWYWRDPWTIERHVADLLAVYREVLGFKTVCCTGDRPDFSGS
ncbi:MAG TPA: glycosyltransferase family 4 protein [Chthoniobacter sp.]